MDRADMMSYRCCENYSVVLIDIRTYSTLSNLVSGLECLPVGLGDFAFVGSELRVWSLCGENQSNT